MYINTIKDYFRLPSGKIERIDAISKKIKIKKEHYPSEYIQEKNKRKAEKFYMEDQPMKYQKPRFLSPTEVYLNHRNSQKELIYALSMNAHTIYQVKEDVLGKNIDVGI